MPIASFRRPALLAAASGAVLLIAGAGAAQAQNAPGSATSVDDIVVTGTRVANRSRLDTVAPSMSSPPRRWNSAAPPNWRPSWRRRFRP